MLSKNQFVTCIPLVSDNEEDLYREIDEALAQKPDYLEWRRDYFLEDDYEQERRIAGSTLPMRPSPTQLPILTLSSTAARNILKRSNRW